jgi:peptide/nickel transport system substrate-binding protein
MMHSLLRHRRSGLRSFVLAASILAAATGVGAQTLTIGAATTPSIDPHFQFLSTNIAYHRHVFGTLTQINHGTLEPDLAVSWRAVTPTQWEFKLRPNVKFHDGSAFTADDVVFSVKRLSTLANNPISYAGVLASVKEATAVDPLTVRFDSTLPEPMLPSNLAIIAIVSKKAAEGAGTADFNSGKATIGTGPYKFFAYVPGERYEVVRNDAYWGAKPIWQKVVFRLITQDASRIAALLAGEVDLIEQVPPTDAARLRSNPNFAVHQTPSLRFYFAYAFMTPESSPYATDKQGKPLAKNPMRDARVREAMSLAIDRKAITQRVMDGAAEPINQFGSPSMPSYNRDLPELAYDPTRAKKLLAEAGYPEGFGLTVHCSNDRYPNDGRICQTLGQMLSRIGLDMKVEAQPKAVYFPKIFPPKGEYLVGFLGWGAVDGTAVTGLTGIIHSFDPARKLGTYNVMGFTNPALDARIEALSSEFDMSKRTALERALLSDVAKDWPVIPLYAGSVVLASKKGLAYTARSDEFTLAAEARPAR